MKEIIKRYPTFFGAVLLLGIVCSAYLLSVALGEALRWTLHQWPGHYLMNSSLERNSSVDTYLMWPVFGLFLGAATYLAILMLGMVLWLIKASARGVCGTIRRLGKWLVQV
jgi:hypothetical protein